MKKEMMNTYEVPVTEVVEVDITPIMDNSPGAGTGENPGENGNDE